MTGKIKQLFLLEESRNRIRTPHTHTHTQGEYTFVMYMFRIIYFLTYRVGLGSIVLCCMVLLCVLLCCLVLYSSVLFNLGLSWFVCLFSLMYVLYVLVVAGNGDAAI